MVVHTMMSNHFFTKTLKGLIGPPGPPLDLPLIITLYNDLVWLILYYKNMSQYASSTYVHKI